MTRKILVLPGDGIGPEITAEASRILAACQAAASTLRSRKAWSVAPPMTNTASRCPP